MAQSPENRMNEHEEPLLYKTLISTKELTKQLNVPKRTISHRIYASTLPLPSHWFAGEYHWRRDVIEGFFNGDVYLGPEGKWIFRETGQPIPTLAKFDKMERLFTKSRNRYVA
jgi:hypothetical protein